MGGYELYTLQRTKKEINSMKCISKKPMIFGTISLQEAKLKSLKSNNFKRKKLYLLIRETMENFKRRQH